MGASVPRPRTEQTILPADRWSASQAGRDRKKRIVETVKHDQPQQHQLPGYGWTLKKLQRWVEEQFGRRISRTTLRSLLKQAGLSWKKSKKVLAKADPVQRAAFVEQFQGWFEQVCQGKCRLIYLDEVHIHQELDAGYRWSKVGQADWVPSHCPSLKNRLNWYGAYDFSTGQCLIWQQGACNGDNTVAFLQHLADWLVLEPQETVRIIWDGAAYHSRTTAVRAQAKRLGFELVDLPSYSPDLNPIEGLWKWMREEVTQHHCYRYLYQLERACLDFIERINRDPEAIIRRLWPKFELDPDYEKVLFSF
jgi:transposase